MPAWSKNFGGVLLVGREHGDVMTVVLRLLQVMGSDPAPGLVVSSVA